MEHYASDAHAQNGFVNSLTEVVVGSNAQVQHYRINLEQEDLLHVGGVHVNLQRDARFHGFTLAQGSRLKRIDYQVNMLGEGAHLDLNGIYLPRNRQVIDYHTNVEHCVPHCTSHTRCFAASLVMLPRRSLTVGFISTRRPRKHWPSSATRTC
ncbi:SufD family Fe-S cluster assembly protein [Halopseudomonas pachastrellae]|nr:SufD family Fe-S cluster assembly protein [Halopseudomonas pachastrellae]